MTDPFELEMPAAFLDALVLDPGITSPTIFNRDPEPNEIAVPEGSTVSLDFATVSGSALDASSLEVWINGVVAYAGSLGGFQSGFAGSLSAVTHPDSNTTRIVIDHTALFTSLELVTVRGFGATVDGSTVDQTWSFIVRDFTPPRLISAIVFDRLRVRVVADKALKVDDPTASDDALNPVNWAIGGLEPPFVTVQVLSVAEVVDSVFDLIVDREPTERSRYRVTVTNVSSQTGNVFVAPNNTADFDGRKCSPVERNFDVYKLYPLMNRLEDTTQDLAKFAAVLQDLVDVLLCDIDRFIQIADIDYAPENFVDLMLADLGNPFRFDLDLVQKKKLAKILVQIYRLKGTKIGIIEVVAFFLGLAIDIIGITDEGWILGDSFIGVDTDLFPAGTFNLYAFQVIVQQALTQEQVDGIVQIVELMKPAHTHFVRIVEPTIPAAIDHLELGLSELGINWELH